MANHADPEHQGLGKGILDILYATEVRYCWDLFSDFDSIASRRVLLFLMRMKMSCHLHKFLFAFNAVQIFIYRIFFYDVQQIWFKTLLINIYITLGCMLTKIHGV